MKILLSILIFLGIIVLIEAVTLLVVILAYSVIGAIKDGKENL